MPWTAHFSRKRLQRAAAYRETVVENTDCYRLVHGEADLLPSIVIDRYGDYLVLQTLSQASERQKGVIVEILVELFSPKGILERNDPKVRLLEGLAQSVSVLHGDVPEEILAKENGITFVYDLAKGTEDRIVPRSTRKSLGRAALRIGRSAGLLQLPGRFRADGCGSLPARGRN